MTYAYTITDGPEVLYIGPRIDRAYRAALDAIMASDYPTIVIRGVEATWAQLVTEMIERG